MIELSVRRLHIGAPSARMAAHLLLTALTLAACEEEAPPYGRPCIAAIDCGSEYYFHDRRNFSCEPRHAFTCQAGCAYCDGRPAHGFSHCCPDQSRCPESRICPVAVVPEHTCEPAGQGCLEGEVCRTTNAGVRRCFATGCNPTVGARFCYTLRGEHDTGWCLPDPEGTAGAVCWTGGTLLPGEPCTSTYQCGRGVCARDGVCRPHCPELCEGTCIEGACYRGGVDDP